MPKIPGVENTALDFAATLMGKVNLCSGEPMFMLSSQRWPPTARIDVRLPT
jgi:hypothetical protein